MKAAEGESLRQCTKCGRFLPLTEFHKCKARKDGLRAECKACVREYGRRWYQKNKRRRYEKGRAWVERNRQRYSELQRRWYQANRDAHKRGVQLRRRLRPEMMAVYVANGKARKMGCQGRLKVSDWIAVKERYGHRCLCCGAHESQVKLTIDHIVPLSKGGQNTIDNIQPLCIRCNCKKWTQVIDYRSGRGKAAEGA